MQVVAKLSSGNLSVIEPLGEWTRITEEVELWRRADCVPVALGGHTRPPTQSPGHMTTTSEGFAKYRYAAIVTSLVAGAGKSACAERLGPL